MNKRVLALAGIGVAICLSTGILLTVGQLLQRIDHLTTRVEQLERRQPAMVFQPVSNQPTAVAPVLPSEVLPDGWSQHEFNGQPYYIVPLVASHSVTP